MKFFRGKPFWLLLTLAFLLGVFTTRISWAKNFVTNPGFEQSAGEWPAAWWCGGARWSYENKLSHSGSRCLKVAYSKASTVRDTVGQSISSIIPGECYQVGAWIKTENVTGPGATIFIEWLHNSQWLYGEWGFQKITGTHDWQFISLDSVQIPEEATEAQIYLALSKGASGTVWFDDVVVKGSVEPLLTSFVLRPNYAGKILPNSPSPEIEAEITLNPEDYSLSLDQLKLTAVLKNQAGNTIIKKDINSFSSNTFKISLDVSAHTAPGVYGLTIELYTKSGDLLDQNVYSLDKLSQERFWGLTSYIDAHNRFILNQKPFFPIGIYMGHDYRWDYARIDEIAASPFNTVMNYAVNVGTPDQIAAYLNYLHEKKLNLIYSLKDYIGHDKEDINTIVQKVDAYKDYPALIAWYLNDESGLECLPELEAGYQKVRELDENHPVWAVNCRRYALNGEAHTTDILGVDPYPIPDKPLTLVSDMADWAQEAGRGDRPFWLVPQIFDPNNYGHPGGAPPTLEQVRAMSYLATNHGARGLIYYSYFDIRKKDYYQTYWAEVKKIASEIDSLSPVFLSLEDTGESDITCDPNSCIDIKSMKKDNKYYLFAVNTSKEKIEVSFQNNLAYKLFKVNVLFEGGRQIIVTNGNNFTDNFLPYAVHVYEFEAAIPAPTINSRCFLSCSLSYWREILKPLSVKLLPSPSGYSNYAGDYFWEWSNNNPMVCWPWVIPAPPVPSLINLDLVNMNLINMKRLSLRLFYPQYLCAINP